MNLFVCFLALHLCIPVDLSPAPDMLSPQVYNGTLFPDNGIGLHACYNGEAIWDIRVGHLVVFNNGLYRVVSKRVYEMGATPNMNRYDLWIFTCWQPDWREKCFVTHEGWNWRLIIGMEKVKGLEQ